MCFNWTYRVWTWKKYARGIINLTGHDWINLFQCGGRLKQMLAFLHSFSLLPSRAPFMFASLQSIASHRLLVCCIRLNTLTQFSLGGKFVRTKVIELLVVVFISYCALCRRSRVFANHNNATITSTTAHFARDAVPSVFFQPQFYMQ